jgi:hypothetical protein
MTAYRYRQPVAKSAPEPDGQPGYEWGALDVKVCAAADAPESAISNEPWTLRYADATGAGPSSTGYDSFPKPEYIWGEEQLRPGSCVRGWITFPVPEKQRPVTAEYATLDGEFAAWSLK